MTDVESDSTHSIVIDLDAPMQQPLPELVFMDSAFAQAPFAQAPFTQAMGAASGRIGLVEYLARVHAAQRSGLPSLARHMGVGRGETLLICGGGPSMGDLATIKTIRALAQKGAKVWAVNKTHDFLLSKNIKPWAACLLDPMPWVADYIQKPRTDVLYAVASQCHADVFGRLHAYSPHLWHAGIDDVDGEGYPTDILQREYAGQDWLVVPGPTTVGLRSILVGYALGFRRFHLFGVDSSMRVLPDHSSCLHAYDKPRPSDAVEGWVSLRTKTGEQRFFTNSHMARQAQDFEDTMERIAEMVRTKAMQPIRVCVHGDGLLPALARCYGWHADQVDTLSP
jgi:hypothetical protein